MMRHKAVAMFPIDKVRAGACKTNLVNGHELPLRSKEISWLEFNERVLREAGDQSVPLLERLRFLGIYSSNLDEFFRVRVATLNRLVEAPSGHALRYMNDDPGKLLKKVHNVVRGQQKQFDRTYAQLVRDLQKEGINIIDERKLNANQRLFITEFFHKYVRPKLFPIMIDRNSKYLELKDKGIYLAVSLKKKRERLASRYAVIEVPESLSRFIQLPETEKSTHIMFLDDVIRANLDTIFAAFKFRSADAYTIKVTRDAELDIDNDMFESYVRKVRKSLKRRKEGNPVRLVVDEKIDPQLLKLIIRKLDLDKRDPVIKGGRYHNFKDFTKFPQVGRAQLRYKPLVQINHADIVGGHSILDAVRRHDIMLHFPFHPFSTFITMLQEASIDPTVSNIRITLYRAAQHSSVVNALMNAVKNGKSVIAVVELQARFDEEANINWADQLQEAGATVIFGVPGLKVHNKLCLITRNTEGPTQVVAMGTGNFNEDTALLYTDLLLLTANKKITREAEKLYDFLENNYKKSSFSQLFVSPFSMRRKLTKLIHNEATNAAKGKPAYIVLKLNHLTDPGMIKQLYKASQEGVVIRLMVRGMLSLCAGVRGYSENIQAVRLIDRYLEHTRVMLFANGGNEKYYITSADWMPRNLDRRIEAACPVHDEGLKVELKYLLELYWRDNTKSLPHDNLREKAVRKQNETYRAQVDVFEYLRKKGQSAGVRKYAKSA